MVKIQLADYNSRTGEIIPLSKSLAYKRILNNRNKNKNENENENENEIKIPKVFPKKSLLDTYLGKCKYSDEDIILPLDNENCDNYEEINFDDYVDYNSEEDIDYDYNEIIEYQY